jgi:ribosomal protein S18 acetylase RimI-like enzyme
MVRVHRATMTEQWEAAGVVLSEYVPWMRATAGFDPLAQQPSFATELTAVLAAAAEGGCNSLWLESVRDVLDPVIAVYRRNGFTDAGQRPRTLSLDGAVVMERLLEPANRQ